MGLAPECNPVYVLPAGRPDHDGWAWAARKRRDDQPPESAEQRACRTTGPAAEIITFVHEFRGASFVSCVYLRRSYAPAKQNDHDAGQDSSGSFYSARVHPDLSGPTR